MSLSDEAALPKAPPNATGYSPLTTARAHLRTIFTPLGISSLIALAQLALLIAEEQAIATRGELTMDYEVFARAFTLIGHGQLNPSVYIPGAVGLFLPYISNHFELLTWPLALILVGMLRLPVHVVLLDLLQAIPTAAIGPLAALWASRRATERGLQGLAKSAVIIFPAIISALDVWQYRSASFDFHYQALQGALLIAAFLAFDVPSPRSYRLGWATLLVLAMSGDTAGLIIIIIAVWLLMKRRWRDGLAAALLSLTVVVLPSILHDNIGSVLATNAYLSLAGTSSGSASASALVGALIGIAQHPAPALSRLTTEIPNLLALAGGAGLLGLAAPISLVGVATVWLPSALGGLIFTYPGGFQTVPVTDLLILSSGSLMVWAMSRSRVLGSTLTFGSILWAAGWTAIFGPPLVSGILNVSTPTTGKSLRTIARALPANAQVVTSNGSLGDLGTRGAYVSILGCAPTTLRITGQPLEVVLSPWREIQICGPAQLLSEVAYFDSLRGAHLSILPGGVYWISWIPHARSQTLTIPPSAVLNAKLLQGIPFAHGRLDRTPAGTMLVSRKKGGFVFEGITAELPPGVQGTALTTLRVTGRAQLQVFDDTTGALLAERQLIGTSTSEVVRISFSTPPFVEPAGFTEGQFPLAARFLSPLRLDPIELRLWVPSRGASAAAKTAWIGITPQAP